MDIENNFDIQKLKNNLLKYVKEHKKLSVYTGAILLILLVSFCTSSTKQTYNLSQNQKDAIAAAIKTFNELPERRDKSVFCATFAAKERKYTDGSMSTTTQLYAMWLMECYRKIYPEISDVEEKASVKAFASSGVRPSCFNSF